MMLKFTTSKVRKAVHFLLNMIIIFILLNNSSLIVIAESDYWDIDIVDQSSDDVGVSPSLDLDARDSPHISYTDYTNGCLKYAYKANKKWITERIEGNFLSRCLPTSLMLDNSDNPFIAYHRSPWSLKYAFKEDENWQTEKTRIFSTDFYLSLSLDDAGNPFILFLKADNSLHLAYKKNDFGLRNWEELEVERGVPLTHSQCFSSSIDNNNTLHIIYVNIQEELKYATLNEYGWEKEKIDDNIKIGYPSLALDSKNFPHICYYDNDNNELTYVFKNSRGWSNRTVDYSAEGSSIALDSRDFPHISYHDDKNNIFKYSYWNGHKFVTETIDDDNIGTSSSLALDSNDLPHISYYDKINGNLKYATKIRSHSSSSVNFNYTPNKPIEKKILTFEASLKNDLTEKIKKYFWDFGNGNIKSGKLIKYAFRSPGLYPVTLTVVNDNNETDSITKEIQVIKDDTPPDNIFNFTFSELENGSVLLSWSPSSDNVNVDFYTISRNDVFLVNNSSNSFIDTTVDPCMSYSYSINAVDVNGNEGNISEETITLSCPNVTADAGGPYTNLIGNLVFFDGSQSSSKNTSIISYEWSFGDGSNDTGKHVYHSYSLAGNYSVELTVIAENESARDITYAIISIPQPVVSGNLFENNVCGDQGKEYNFTVSISSMGNCSVWYEIDWGDGNKNMSDFLPGNKSVVLRHEWSDAGIYNVSVRCSDGYSFSKSFSFKVWIDTDYGSGALEGVVFDEDGDGVYDVFTENSSGSSYDMQYFGAGRYEFSIGPVTYEYVFDDKSIVRSSFGILPLLLAGSFILVLLGVFIVYKKLVKKPKSVVRVRDLPNVTAEEQSSFRCVVCKGKIKTGFSGVRCQCGAVLHRSCAERLGECPICGVKYIPPDKK